jgi:hypothetical protein
MDALINASAKYIKVVNECRANLAETRQMATRRDLIKKTVDQVHRAAIDFKTCYSMIVSAYH